MPNFLIFLAFFFLGREPIRIDSSAYSDDEDAKAEICERLQDKLLKYGDK